MAMVAVVVMGMGLRTETILEVHNRTVMVKMPHRR